MTHCPIGENYRKCYSPPHGGLYRVIRGLGRHPSFSRSRAEGLYEASVLGLCAFRKHDLEPGGLTQLEVEVRSSVTHTLTVTKVREWLQRGVSSPKQAILKERLRALL